MVIPMPRGRGRYVFPLLGRYGFYLPTSIVDLIILVLIVFILIRLFVVASFYVIALVILLLIREFMRPRYGRWR